jgi:hypothetical protein
VYAPGEGGGGPLSRQAKWMSSPTAIARTFAADMGVHGSGCIWHKHSGWGCLGADFMEAKQWMKHLKYEVNK